MTFSEAPERRGLRKMCLHSSLDAVACCSERHFEHLLIRFLFYEENPMEDLYAYCGTFAAPRKFISQCICGAVKASFNVEVKSFRLKSSRSFQISKHSLPPMYLHASSSLSTFSCETGIPLPSKSIRISM